MTTRIGFRDPKWPSLEANRGSRAGVGEFFNKLVFSEKFAHHLAS